MFEEELAGLGFQLKERPWYDDPFQVVAELCHNKRVATDMGGRLFQVRRETDALRALRRRLTGLERQRLRELGRTLSLAVEATCRNFDPGEREADVAGHLAHRLIREGVVRSICGSPAMTGWPGFASRRSRPRRSASGPRSRSPAGGMVCVRR